MLSLVYAHYGQSDMTISFLLSVMLGAFFTIQIFILISWQGLEQICDEIFEKIEQ